jgi:2-C-methyl-D-erythritol 4-phosphate cytidylyltransferase
MRTAVLVLGAGRGQRLGGAVPKAFVMLAGQSLLERSLSIMARVREIDLVQPVIDIDHRARYDALGLDMGPRLAAPVPGGVERQDSVAAGLDALPPDIELVAVHDAARCLVTSEDVVRVLAAASRHAAALLATPARDTIKRVQGGRVVETPDRASCWVAQTPQVFHTRLLREALDKARADGVRGTDDAQLVERLGVAVHVVEGRADNIKVTLPADLRLAEQLLAARAGAA